MEQESQKRTGLQSELKTAQQQITQLKAAEKQLSKVLFIYFMPLTCVGGGGVFVGCLSVHACASPSVW